MDIDVISKKLQSQGLQDRSSQREMIQAVFDALSQQKILCIEAPTGTGKTLSYALASLYAQKPKQYIIISTATIALQEQLMSKDLPLLSKLANKEFKYALAKGRRRYVCHARLYDGDNQGDLLDTKNHIQELQQLLEAEQWSGDRDELKTAISESDWQQISTDAAGCSGPRCSFYEECAFYKARRKMHQADMIISNHSLLLSDLELGGGAILPAIENSVYIIDECHHLPKKALDHFAKTSTLMGNVDWINQLTKAISKAAQLNEINEHTPETLKPLTHHLVQQLKAMNDFLEDNQKRFADSTWIPTLTDMAQLMPASLEIKQAAHQVLSHIQLIHSSLETKIAHNEKAKKEPNEELSRLLTNVTFILSHAKNLHDTWALFCQQRESHEAPIAKWFAEDTYKNFHCHAAPINVSRELKAYLWDKIENGAVLCSATLRALGNFNDFHRRSGLKDDDRCTDLAIDSFFDYSKSVLFVPAMTYAPQGAEQAKHHQEVVELLPKLIPQKNGTLVLFTSIRSMEQTYNDLARDITHDVLMQNQHSKKRIIELHKDRIRAGNRSILFGLASFGEGLDLPADFCEHVIIYKLPFSVPTTPIELTRNEWLKSHNKDAFTLSTLPETSLKLTQYVGRLIRQETDIGIVTILDKRLYARPYGKMLLNNLPKFQQLINVGITQLHEAMPNVYNLEPIVNR